VKSDHGLVNSSLALAFKHGILPASVAHGAATLPRGPGMTSDTLRKVLIVAAAFGALSIAACNKGASNTAEEANTAASDANAAEASANSAMESANAAEAASNTASADVNATAPADANATH
jgi:hypothetical protein